MKTNLHSTGNPSHVFILPSFTIKASLWKELGYKLIRFGTDSRYNSGELLFYNRLAASNLWGALPFMPSCFLLCSQTIHFYFFILTLIIFPLNLWEDFLQITCWKLLVFGDKLLMLKQTLKKLAAFWCQEVSRHCYSPKRLLSAFLMPGCCWVSKNSHVFLQ